MERVISKRMLNSKTLAKPFVKWAGGKGALIKQLIEYLPANFNEYKNVTYVEPFVGGGAMLFYMLTHYPNIKRAVINDINQDLISCYKLIKSNPNKLILLLRNIEKEYRQLSSVDEKRVYYYQMREKYNNDVLSSDERAACFIFLNKTCFNGLYRVNSNGRFNVPFGRYKSPKICDEDVILADHKVLKKVDIYIGAYCNITKHLGKSSNFLYIDPPYRPLSNTSSFRAYSNSPFGDQQQVELKRFCDRLTRSGCDLMLSNSDSKNENGSSFFEDLYEGYNLNRILAPRYINANKNKRNKLHEVVILNY